MKKLAALLAVVALCAPASAGAHYGDIWFQTAARMADNIDEKYEKRGTVCWAITPEWRARFNAHSQVDRFGTRRWDHFVCAVSSSATGNFCGVIAHQTGKEWFNIVLTSGPARGCGPADLRKTSTLR
jgi:hypothetical protein